jgi:methionine sulfoxide reductase heme-binding subunit
VNQHVWWYAARAGGIVAWVLLALAVAWGLLLSTRVLDRRPTPAWLLDSHRFLGGLSVVFVGVHVAGLVGDSYVHFGWSEVLLPFASAWKPWAVALGVVAMWLLVAVEVTSLLMRRLPRRLWRAVHSSSFVLFVLAGLHGATAGTDHANVLYRDVTAALIVAALFLVFVRILAPRRARRARRESVALRSAA